MNSARLVGLGLFVVVGITLFAFGLFMIGNRRMLFKHSFEVYAEFSQLSGLQNGAKVRVSGRDAGEITDIQVPPGPSGKFRVKARIIEDMHQLVRTDSVATIQTDGLVGNKYLQIAAGTEQAPRAPQNTTIRSREPFEIADLLAEASETVRAVNTVAFSIKDDLERTVREAGDTLNHADDVIQSAGEDIKSIAASGNKIASDLSVITSNVRQGNGTVGKLFTDDELYRKINAIAGNAQLTFENIRDASERAKNMIGNFQNSEQSGNSLTTDLRRTLRNANEVMSDMAQNTEALKHNFFFRGFFKKRGFYDVDNLTLVDYQENLLNSKDLKSNRRWVSATDLYDRSSTDDIAILSDQGKQTLDSMMADFLRYPINSLLVIEGYCDRGTRDQQFLRSRSNAVAVRQYLIQKYQLDPEFVAIMPMGSGENAGAKTWNGVSLVLFFSKDTKIPVR